MNENNKKDNRGYLYPNKNKNKPTQPDMTGKVMIEGKDWRISAWENQTPEGNKYLSLAFSPPIKSNNEQVNKTETILQKNKPSVEEDFDLEAILNSADDENPFN